MSASVTDTQGIIALAAGAVAIIALLCCGALALTLRRLRADQRRVLGRGAERDLVAHAAELQDGFVALREQTDEVAERVAERLGHLERALTGVFSHRALVRYDAYNELSGRQSLSIALLDATRSGIVLTCIHHRDQARVYAKQLRDGQSDLELSPEESEAVQLALSGDRG